MPEVHGRLDLEDASHQALSMLLGAQSRQEVLRARWTYLSGHLGGPGKGVPPGGTVSAPTSERTVPVTDAKVLAVQQWVNATYGGVASYERCPEDGRTGWTTMFSLIEGPRMSPVVEVAVYHVASEALTNTARHAHASVAQGPAEELHVEGADAVHATRIVSEDVQGHRSTQYNLHQAGAHRLMSC